MGPVDLRHGPSFRKADRNAGCGASYDGDLVPGARDDPGERAGTLTTECVADVRNRDRCGGGMVDP
jgi:hypothetical protein